MPRTRLRFASPRTVISFVLLVGALVSLSCIPCFAATDWNWIWAKDGAHPAETVYFRQKFRLSKAPLSARLLITADDGFLVYLNGSTKLAATGADWTTVQEFNVMRLLKAGDNVLAIECRNDTGPGGLLYKLILKLPGGKTLTLTSDAHVKYTRRPPPLWIPIAFDDSKWQTARELAPANGGVWGALRGAPLPDPTRIVRLWDIRAGGKSSDDPYSRTRNYGDRMLLSTSVSSSSEMQILRSAGFTLFQTDSDHLSTEQTAPGKWDWSAQGSASEAVHKLGLDWCYFPHNAFPPLWYRKSVPFTRIQSLEDGKPAEAFSPWEPKWNGFVEQSYEALAAAFNGGTKTTISALTVGIHGDYGEAGLLSGARVAVPGQREDWIRRFGNDHDRLGFWCGDPLARADFRSDMIKRYGGLDGLNAAWKTAYKSPADVAYPEIPDVQPSVSGRRQWVDFVQWYQSSVGRAIELNLHAARQHFPDTLLMLPAGFADENVRGGNDNSLIPKLAVRYKANVRSTHGAFKPFAENAATMLGRLGSASRFYGAPFWTEPPGSLTATQEVERIFEAVSQGAVGHFDWAGNAVANRDVYYRYGKYLRVSHPITDVAMFYPADAQRLRVDQGYAATFAKACAYLRESANFDIVDDRMVRDGCLAGYRVMALWEGTIADAGTLAKIKQWVNDGGVLLAYDFGKVTTFEGDTSWFKDMFGYAQELRRATVTERYRGAVPAQYRFNLEQTDFSDFLGGDWYDPDSDATGIEPGRWAGASASVLLPVGVDKRYTLILRAAIPPEAAALKHTLLLNGRKLGDLSAGEGTYRFLLPEGSLSGKSLSTLTFQSQTYQPIKLTEASKDARALGVRVLSIQMVEQGATESIDAPTPSGTLRRELDLTRLSPGYKEPQQSWARLYGKGMTIYFPANRSLLKGYIEVVRRAVYHLSAIDPARRDALPIGDTNDGVYATLFTDKILYYNSKDAAVTKKVTIPAEAFAAWRNEVAVPTENTWTLKMEPHSISAIYLTPPAQELLFECEAFTELGTLKPSTSVDCSPGQGMTCVRLLKGAQITTHFRVDSGGKYSVYARTVRGARLEPADISIDGQALASTGARLGQTLGYGAAALTKGTHTLTVRARIGHDLRADFVLLSSDPTIRGYDFAVRTVPVE